VIHPYLQELLLPHWDAAGLNRVASIGGELEKKYTILFNPVNGPIAVQLAKKYIENFRISGNDSVSDIYPFTEDALLKAHKYEQGIPGRYLQLLYQAIEVGIENDWDVIDDNKIEIVLSKKSAQQSISLENPDVNLME
jgi:hypothetical protein